jgi:tetratricopeptide (TPR) repeat protein
MGKLSQQNDWEGWLEGYRTLPDNVRNSRVRLTTRIGVASAAGNEDEYKSAMSDLHANQGDDPTLSLALVDYYLLTGDFARAYEAVDRLDKYTGGDVALTNLRAGIALYEGDNPASIRYARRAIAQDEGYEDPYWNILVAGSRAGDFEAAMEGLRELETRFGYEFSEDELTASEDLSRLAASEAWSSARGAVVEDAEGLP